MDTRIDQGKIGSMFLRLKTKRVGEELNQRALVESLEGKPIELQVKGEIVPDLVLSPIEINVPKFTMSRNIG